MTVVRIDSHREYRRDFFLVLISFDAKGFCYCVERAHWKGLSGSDGILNFKSPEGSQSEIEP